MIGTNDIAQNPDLPNAPKRLGGLIDKLVMHAPDALIVVATITPLSRSSVVARVSATDGRRTGSTRFGHSSCTESSRQ